MNEQRTRFERGLNECAERGIPADLDLWPEIEKSASSVHARSGSTSWISRARVRWTIVALVIFVFGTGAYAATGVFDIENRVEQIFFAETPGVEQENLGVPLDLRQSKDGVSVTLVQAYADSDNVAIGFSVNNSDGHGGQTVSVPSSSLTDESGTKFRVTDGSSQSFPGETSGVSNVILFESGTRLRSDSNHRFRLKVDAENSQNGASIPFTFDFEVPVLPISTTVLNLNQEVRANGLPLTLKRIEFSPAVNRAVLCPAFDTPDDGPGWMPVVRSERLGRISSPVTDLSIAQSGCATMTLSEPLYGDPGRHRLTVTEIRQGMSQDNPQGRRTYGPWTFDFDVPQP